MQSITTNCARRMPSSDSSTRRSPPIETRSTSLACSSKPASRRTRPWRKRRRSSKPRKRRIRISRLRGLSSSTRLPCSCGQPASTFSLPAETTGVTPPAIPVGLPAQLLERRPDVAGAERRMAQANAQIGIATAAFFPNVTLTAGAGFESTSFLDWLTWPSRFWSVGPALAQTLFDAGLRRATVEQYQASFNQAVASYRGTVLTAFQQVEDNLAALRILAREIQQQDTAVESAAQEPAASPRRGTARASTPISTSSRRKRRFSATSRRPSRCAGSR